MILEAGSSKSRCHQGSRGDFFLSSFSVTLLTFLVFNLDISISNLVSNLPPSLQGLLLLSLPRHLSLDLGPTWLIQSFPGGSEVKVFARNAGDPGSIPGSLGREDSPREGNGNPLQYSCLENPMEGGAW